MMCVMHRLILSFLCLLPALTFAAPGIDVVDDTGRHVSLRKPAQRIVSLAPHVTELLFAAGAGEAVAGVVSFSNYPPAATRLPVVGGYESLNLEAILALHPDLLVAWKSGNISAQVERLGTLGVPVFYSEPRRLEDIASNLERLGTLAGSSEVADKAARVFRERHRQLQQRYAERTPLRTFYQIWHQPLMTISGEHLISQVIRLCGGHNIFSELPTLASAVNREAVLKADPQVIIASGMAGGKPEWLDAWRDWPQLSAVRDGQLHFIDPDLIQRHTPRILEGAEIMCRQLDEARAALR